MNSKLGDLIYKYRKLTKLTQKGLGDEVGLSGSMISRYESGGAVPSHNNLKLIVDALTLEGLPKEDLEEMQESIGVAQVEALGPATAEPILSLIEREINDSTTEQRNELIGNLSSTLTFERGLFRAERYKGNRNWEQHIKELLSLRDKRERQHQNDFLRLDEKLGQSYFRDGKYNEAIAYLESAVWSTRLLEDKFRGGQILLELGDIHRRVGGNKDWTAALDRYEEARRIYELLGNQVGVTNCKRRGAVVHLYQGLPKEAQILYEECLVFYDEQNDALGTYKTMQQLAWAYDMLGRWKDATSLCEEALSIVEKVSADNQEMAKAWRYLGDTYRLRRINDLAEAAYKNTLEILGEYGNSDASIKHIASVAKLRLGKVYLKIPGKELDAKLYLKESLGTHLELKEEFYIAENLSEQGDFLLRIRRFDEAEMRLQSAETRFKRLGNAYYRAIVLSQLCSLYYEKGDFVALDKAAETARGLNNELIDYQLARVAYTLGKRHLTDKNFSGAASAFCEASERASSFNEETFYDILGLLIEDLDPAASKLTPEVVANIYEEFIKYWERRKEYPNKSKFAQKAIETARQKCLEVLALIVP